MSVDGANRSSIRLYLLGELSEQEREQVEQRLMSDDDLYQQLLVAEDELIDEYVSDALPAGERESFGRRFLQVPELRQDVRFASALRQYARKNAPAATARDSPASTPGSLLDWLRKIFMQPVVGAAFATLAVAALLLAVWLAVQNTQLRKQAEELQARQTPPMPAPSPDLQEQLNSARLRNEQLSAQVLQQQERLAQQEQLARQVQLVEASRELQLARERAQPSPARGQSPRPVVGAFVPLMLTPGAVRESGELRKITLTPGTPGVKIQLDPPAGVYRSYRVVLQTVEGEQRLSKQGLRAGGRARFLTLNVPAKILEPNDYQVLLTGITPAGAPEEIGSYYFRVLK